MIPTHPLPAPRVRPWVAAAAILAMAVGVLVLIGWALRAPLLTSLIPGFVTMKPNTALCFVLTGFALWIRIEGNPPMRCRSASGAAAVLAGLVGACTLLEDLLGVGLGIDQLLFRDPGNPVQTFHPGRMSPITAASFMLVALALLNLDSSRRRPWLAQAAAGLAGLFSLTALMGYLYGAGPLYGAGRFTSIALHTALTFLILSLGILAARPERGLVGVILGDTVAGLAARRLFPAVIGIPVALGALHLLAGRILDRKIDTALLASANIVVGLCILLWITRSLHLVQGQRQRAEQAVLEQAEQTRRILEGSLDAVVSMNEKGTITIWNPQAERLFGWSREEAVGRPLAEVIVPPAFREKHRQGIRRYLETGVSQILNRRIEIAALRRDGTEFPVELAITDSPRGGEQRFNAFLRDLSEKKRTEEKFLTTFEQAAVGIAHVAPDGRWIRVNRRLCDIVGYAREELLQKTFQDITHPEDLGLDLDYVRRMLKGEIPTYSMEKRYFRKDASIVWINLTVSLVRTPAGEPDYFIAVIEDISARKSAEDALKTTEARLRALSDANLIGILVADLRGQVLEANEAFLRMVGYDREDLTSGRVRWTEMTPPAFRELDERAIVQLRSTGVAQPWQKEYVRKDGSRVPVLVGTSMIRGSTDSCVAFVLDLSERRQLEDQLRQAQRMEIIGRLAGGVAHDFNNLLTPILGYSETILGQLRPGERFWEEIDQIRRSGERAAGLTRQLLAFSRKQILQPRVVNLNSLVADVQKLLRRVIGEDVTLQLKLDPALGAVRVDPGQMEQVLMNLAVNARDAMPRGGFIAIETSNVDLDAAYASAHTEVVPGPYTLISFSDTGTGMDPETLKHLFEPFFTTKAPGKGTGLGLATVQGIVRQSGGHVWAYSEMGHGTTFKIYLPRVEQGGTDRRPSPQPLVSRGGTETILLVEDDAALRTFAQRVLRERGYQVLVVASGEAALATSKTHPGTIDLCITDVVMPGMSGRDTAQFLVTLRPGMRVLYMSGYTSNAIVHYGVLEEGLELLEKPFTPDQLAARVREMLDRPRPGPPALLP